MYQTVDQTWFWFQLKLCKFDFTPEKQSSNGKLLKIDFRHKYFQNQNRKSLMNFKIKITKSKSIPAKKHDFENHLKSLILKIK